MNMVAVAAISLILVIPIEKHKRAMERRALFHAAKAREYWTLSKNVAVAAEGCERRSKLGMSSEADEYWFRIGDGPPAMLTPEKWAESGANFRGNVSLFRMMAEQREATERVYRRAMYRPWESAPTNVVNDYIE